MTAIIRIISAFSSLLLALFPTFLLCSPIMYLIGDTRFFTEVTYSLSHSEYAWVATIMDLLLYTAFPLIVYFIFFFIIYKVSKAIRFAIWNLRKTAFNEVKNAMTK